MDSVDPRDRKLRRIHRVYEEHLEKWRPLVKASGSLQPIHVLVYRLPHADYWIVLDGTHRTQAALEENVASIPAREVSWVEAASEAASLGHSLEHLVQHAIPFRPREYGFSPY